MTRAHDPIAVDALTAQLENFRERNKRLEAVIQTLPEGIWVCDSKGDVLIINEAAERFHGCNASDILGKNIITFVNEGYFDESATLQVLHTRKSVSVMQYIKKTKKYLLVTGVPIYNEDGSIHLVVTHGRDMTQLNAIKEALEESRLVAEKFRDELSEISVMELAKGDIVAESKRIRHVLRLALKLAKIEASTILILGESGTGKGLLAKFIHQNSKRRNQPFIQINCAALPDNLLEAELFGYEKGAFTGASEKGKAGLFELAQGGTLFLDEIGDLSLPVQAKLLKYLDDREVLRLGSLKPRRIDCVVITATNRDLEALKTANRFRNDLFFRLNSFTLTIPPLRERREDILEMLDHFQRKYGDQYGIKRRISKETLRKLQSHDFPGNVRELKNLVKKALVLGDEAIFGADEGKPMAPAIRSSAGREAPAKPLFHQIETVEREILTRAMNECRTTREIASILKVDQSTVVRKMRKLGLSKKR